MSPVRMPSALLLPLAYRNLAPFLLWLLFFYSLWFAVLSRDDNFQQALAHWPIALAMSFGSYIAGSTPMGGGTVGFPILVLLFDMPGSLGRNFGLAIQSVGMVSASIYILSLKKTVAWGLLRPALLGSLVGTSLGAVFIAPLIPDIWIKLTFAIIWASFGIIHLLKMRELIFATGLSTKWKTGNWPIGLAIGLMGGVVASVTGVGIDMLIYAILVLLFRADLKIAIPTSVILMAFTSLVGIATNSLLSRWDPLRYPMDPEVFNNWLAAAPVVALGAPFGAYVVSLISRTPTLLLVSLLCIAQFLWTVVEESVTGWSLFFSVGAVLLCNAAFLLLFRMGKNA